MSKTKLRKSLKKWHRRAGIVSSFFVLLLSVTGVLLNHTSELGLSQASVNSTVAKSLYGLPSPKVQSFPFRVDGKNTWLSLVDQSLYYDQNNIFQCDSPLVGVHYTPQNWFLACRNHLVTFDSTFQVVDIDTPAYGLPESINGIGPCGSSFCVNAKLGSFRYNLKQASWESTNLTPAIARTVAAPTNIKTAIIANYQGDILSWERVVLDIHAGRFIGVIGPWIMDLMAILFIILAMSGVFLWLKSNKKIKQKTKKKT